MWCSGGMEATGRESGLAGAGAIRQDRFGAVAGSVPSHETR